MRADPIQERSKADGRTHNNLDESPRPYAERKKAGLRGYTLHDSIYTLVLRRQNDSEGERSGAPRGRAEGD